MNLLKFSYLSSCLVEKKDIKKARLALIGEIQKINNELVNGYDTSYASLNLVEDQVLLEFVNSLVACKKLLLPKVLVVIGIGGSNLGTLAVCQAIKGTLFNDIIDDSSSELKVYFADTIAQDYTDFLLKIIEKQLKSGNEIILNVISKSGTTTETVVNFNIFLDLLKKYRPTNYQDFVVITTDKDSKLWNLAQKEKFSSLEIPKYVGGRYSVFSAVGLFPLGMLNIDIKSLLEGAFLMRHKCLKKFDTNPAVISASIIYNCYLNKINIHDTFVFNPNFGGLGQWYRQLVGESLGKQFNVDHKEIFAGITPTVSVGTIDLHSVAQLYLGGPYDKFTTFLTYEHTLKKSQPIPEVKEINFLSPEISGKTLGNIVDAIFSGVASAYKKTHRPFVKIVFPEINEYYIGQFLQFKMLETIFLAKLMGVNPFDQPQVELYKTETKKILK